MSTDKLADTISNDDGYMDHYAEAAAARVRERFVVIDRNDLPKVTADDGTNIRIGSGSTHWYEKGLDSGFLRQHAHRLLVAADWMDEHPPVDAAREEKVRKVYYALMQALGPVASHSPLDRAARLLVEALEEE